MKSKKKLCENKSLGNFKEIIKEEKLNKTDQKIKSLFSLNPIMEEEEKD